MSEERMRWRPPGWTGPIGVARRSIDAPVGIRMRNWGYGDADVSRGVHRPLGCTALALGPDDDAQLLLTLDLGWWRTFDDFAGVMTRIVATTGVPAERVLLHLTHTHAGPSICAEDADLPGGEVVPEYLAHVADAAAEAAAAALASRAPATLTTVATAHPLAANRDVECGGEALLGFDPGAPADQTVLVGLVSGADGSPIATLVNYACHPTSLGYDNDQLSPDYVGAMREVVEEETGAPCLFLQGASGELAPRVQYGADTELTDRHGRSLGHAVLAALETLPPSGAELELAEVIQSGAPLAIWAAVPGAWPTGMTRVDREVPVRVKELAPIDELERQWAHIDPRSRTERIRRARRLRRTYDDMGAPKHPLWVWRLGDVAVVAHPGEAYSALQTELRRRFPDRSVFVLNLVNGPGWVYLPPRAAYDEGRYQSWQTIAQPGTLEDLIEEAAAALVATGFEERRD